MPLPSIPCLWVVTYTYFCVKEGLDTNIQAIFLDEDSAWAYVEKYEEYDGELGQYAVHQVKQSYKDMADWNKSHNGE